MKSWYERSGQQTDVFVSTRVRLARNISGYPFDSRMTDSMSREIADKVAEAFAGDSLYKITDMAQLTSTQAAALCEKHYISRQFAEKNAPRLLVTSENGLSVMVGEEDHLRIQCLCPGFDIDGCAAAAFETEERISGTLPYAFDEKLGYLTHCQTNLGTGMRVSVMMFLPALSMSGRIDRLISDLQKAGLVVRGMQGEGSRAVSHLYQISNQITLGVSEENIMRKVSELVTQIADMERRARAAISGTGRLVLRDRACRSEGILRCCRMISTEEFLRLWADLRLGISMGDIGHLTTDKADRLLWEMQPAGVALMPCDVADDYSPETLRDIKRADAIRRELAHTS